MASLGHVAVGMADAHPSRAHLRADADCQRSSRRDDRGASVCAAAGLGGIDTGPDWDAVAALVREAYLTVATTKLRNLVLAPAGSVKPR